MRFSGRQVSLNMLQGWKAIDDCCDLVRRSHTVFSDVMNMIVMLGMAAGDIDVDEGAQAIILAEVAARGFVARGAVLNLADRVQADESCLLAISPEPQGFLGRANGAGFSTMFVHNDLRLLASSAKTITDEIHFRLHYCEIILRSSLQHKTRA